jgi:hypothetical protein
MAKKINSQFLDLLNEGDETKKSTVAKKTTVASVIEDNIRARQNARPFAGPPKEDYLLNLYNEQKKAMIDKNKNKFQYLEAPDIDADVIKDFAKGIKTKPTYQDYENNKGGYKRALEANKNAKVGEVITDPDTGLTYKHIGQPKTIGKPKNVIAPVQKYKKESTVIPAPAQKEISRMNYPDNSLKADNTQTKKFNPNTILKQPEQTLGQKPRIGYRQTFRDLGVTLPTRNNVRDPNFKLPKVPPGMFTQNGVPLNPVAQGKAADKFAKENPKTAVALDVLLPTGAAGSSLLGGLAKFGSRIAKGSLNASKLVLPSFKQTFMNLTKFKNAVPSETVKNGDILSSLIKGTKGSTQSATVKNGDIMSKLINNSKKPKRFDPFVKN